MRIDDSCLVWIEEQYITASNSYNLTLFHEMTTTTSLINIIVLLYYELQRVSILISCVVVWIEQHSIDNYQNYFYPYVMFLTSLLNILQKCNNLFRWNYSLKQVYMGITRFHIIKSESNIGPNYCKKRNWKKLKTRWVCSRYLCAIIFLSLFLCVCVL